MRKIKLKPFKPKLPKNAVFVSFPSEIAWHIYVIEQERRRQLGDLWNRILAALRGETYD